MREKIFHTLEWIIGFLLVIALVYGSFTMSRNVVETDVTEKVIEVILDPGHGGKDPGKIGVNGKLEKDINLLIAKKVKALLEKDGISVYLTRNTDVRLSEIGEAFSKTEDMKDRVKIINEIRPKLVISIHQNSYSSGEIKGGQTFYYSESEPSRGFAEIMQESIRTIDSSNDRQAKGDNTYYLLKKTEVPTVIVECGFLSNWEEAEKLSNDDYQNEMAEAIANGIKSCLENTSQNENGSV